LHNNGFLIYDPVRASIWTLHVLARRSHFAMGKKNKLGPTRRGQKWPFRIVSVTPRPKCDAATKV